MRFGNQLGLGSKVVIFLDLNRLVERKLRLSATAAGVWDPVAQAIVEEAHANQTDGYHMICAFVRHKLGIAVNRTRVLRVVRRGALIHTLAGPPHAPPPPTTPPNHIKPLARLVLVVAPHPERC